jgi:hypothetical protein
MSREICDVGDYGSASAGRDAAAGKEQIPPFGRNDKRSGKIRPTHSTDEMQLRRKLESSVTILDREGHTIFHIFS